MNFSHIALNCRDIDVTERFYVEHFGFARARNIPLGGNARITFIRNGSMLLELFAAEGDRPDGEGDGPHGAGIRHIAFQVEDVDAVLAKLGGAAPITAGPMDFFSFIPGWRTVWVKDPDGNIVEISQGYRDEDGA
jgi:glyoxylase I family protein